VSERRWSSLAVLSAALGCALAAWSQRAQWHVRVSQADVLAGRADTASTPATALGVVLSAAVCVVVAVWVLPVRGRQVVGALSIIASCAVVAMVAAYASAHRIPAMTLLGAVAATVLVVFAGAVLWRIQTPSAAAAARAARYERVRATSSQPDGVSQSTSKAATTVTADAGKQPDPWKQLDQGLDPTL